jgi:hypothetical protein
MPDEAQQSKHEPSGDQEIAAGLLEFELNPRNFTRAMRQANRMMVARGMSYGSSHRRAHFVGISMRQRGAIG